MKALSPSSSSLFPCLKLRPEKPKLNLNPGIFCASLSCTESISYKSVTAKGRLSFKLFFLSFNSSRGHYVTANNCLRTKVHSCATQKKKLLLMGSLVFVGQDGGTATSRDYKGNGYKLQAPRFLGSFGWTSASYDWSMVFKATINQSKLGVIQPNDAKNRCPESLCPFPLQFLEWRIQID